MIPILDPKSRPEVPSKGEIEAVGVSDLAPKAARGLGIIEKSIEHR